MAQAWLVTGAAGFIGCNLSAHIMEGGGSVVGFDNFLTGKREHIARLKAAYPANFRFIEGDILNAGEIRGAAAGCRNIAHLAAQVSVQRSIDDMGETNAINVDGFLNTYEAALKCGAKRFVYASSCAVYGDNPDLPLRENSATGPLSPYAVSKLTNELYADVLARLHPRMTATGLRFFNIYGPWQDHNGGYAAVIPRWIAALIKGERPTIFGDGSASRDFCFVSDLCSVVTATAALKSGTRHAVYNVASGSRVSVLELYEEIVRELIRSGTSVPFDGPLYQPHRDGDILHSYADIGAIRNALTYQPKFSLAEGLRAIIGEQWGVAT